jgi:hypothetical protein
MAAVGPPKLADATKLAQERNVAYFVDRPRLRADRQPVDERG